MAKYFTQAISKICHLKYEEAKFVAEQMIATLISETAMFAESNSKKKET